MSATFNAEVFAAYFEGAPVLTISGITHPIADKLVLWRHGQNTSSYSQSDILKILSPLLDTFRLHSISRNKWMKEKSKDWKNCDLVTGTI